MAQKDDLEVRQICEILTKLKLQVIQRAIAAWDRSPGTFGDEIAALNDIDEALHNDGG